MSSSVNHREDNHHFAGDLKNDAVREAVRISPTHLFSAVTQATEKWIVRQAQHRHEVLFGYEIVEQLPKIVKTWVAALKKRQS